MVGDMGHMGDLINPRPWRGQYRAGFSNTGGSPKPRKRAPCQKREFNIIEYLLCLSEDMPINNLSSVQPYRILARNLSLGC